MLPILFVGQLGSWNPGHYHENAWGLAVSSQSPSTPRPPHPPSPGPLHWWTLTRNLKECLPLSDPKASPAATAAAASPPSKTPPPSCCRSHLLSSSLPHFLSLNFTVRVPPSGPSLDRKRTLLLTAAVSHSQLYVSIECDEIMEPSKSLRLALDWAGDGTKAENERFNV